MLEETSTRMFKVAMQAMREGLWEGELQGRRQMLLEQMTLRFGRLPAAVYWDIEKISSFEELRKLGRKVLRAKTLQDMGSVRLDPCY